jgi:hypothetical protein
MESIVRVENHHMDLGMTLDLIRRVLHRKHLQKKAKDFFLGQQSQSPGRLSQNKEGSSRFESGEEDPCQVNKDA